VIFGWLLHRRCYLEACGQLVFRDLMFMRRLLFDFFRLLEHRLLNRVSLPLAKVCMLNNFWLKIVKSCQHFVLMSRSFRFLSFLKTQIFWGGVKRLIVWAVTATFKLFLHPLVTFLFVRFDMLRALSSIFTVLIL